MFFDLGGTGAYFTKLGTARGATEADEELGESKVAVAAILACVGFSVKGLLVNKFYKSYSIFLNLGSYGCYYTRG